MAVMKMMRFTPKSLNSLGYSWVKTIFLNSPYSAERSVPIIAQNVLDWVRC